MAKFLTPLRVEIHDGFEFELLEPLRYVSDRIGHIDVPVGFTFDGASIPRALWATWPPVGPYLRPACIHDYLYRYAPKNILRLTADQIFLEAMTVLQVDREMRELFYTFVKVGGQEAWNHYRAGQPETRGMDARRSIL